MENKKSHFLSIRGRIPSKKNSRCLFVRGGKLVNIPSPQYAKWHKEASRNLPDDSEIANPIDRIELYFYAPDRRASDLTNKAESIMDLLVDNNIIEDDNWWIVNKVLLYFGGVDKANPRCDVYIYTNDKISSNR